jgi:hypothetical protein
METGLIQGQLPGLGTKTVEKESGRKERNVPRCGEHGTPMVWSQRAARGGKYICLECERKER